MEFIRVLSRSQRASGGLHRPCGDQRSTETPSAVPTYSAKYPPFIPPCRFFSAEKRVSLKKLERHWLSRDSVAQRNDPRNRHAAPLINVGCCSRALPLRTWQQSRCRRNVFPAPGGCAPPTTRDTPHRSRRAPRPARIPPRPPVAAALHRPP